jgi:uncharacterized membrane protein YdbT with pleckstrin-like domain
MNAPVATPTELTVTAIAVAVFGAALIVVTNPKRSRPRPRRDTLMPSEATRAYLYRLAVAVIALAAILGWIDVEFIDEIDEVIVAALGLGSAALASANTSTKHPGNDGGH